MSSLLEKALLQQENEVKRRKTIKMLEKKLEEARLLLSIVDGNSFEEQQERMVIGHEIDRLQKFIESEEEAIREGYVSDVDLSKIFN